MYNIIIIFFYYYIFIIIIIYIFIKLTFLIKANSPFLLPKDLKAFYCFSDGLLINWNIQFKGLTKGFIIY